MYHCRQAARIFVGLFVFAPCISALVDHLKISGNPHSLSSEGTLGTCGAELSACARGTSDVVNPLNIISEPRETQSDTLLKVVTKHYLGLPVPIYHFKQPARLSDLELPFKLLLLRSVALESLVEVQVPREVASDSWFPGYYWSILLCQDCARTVHLGWKFTSLVDQEEHFYALIVEYSEDSKRGTAVGLAADFLSEQLRFGMKAPTWMLALLLKQVSVSPTTEL